MVKPNCAKGPAKPSLLEQTIGEALDLAADRWPKQLALVARHQGIRWTWGRLRDELASVASGLLVLGLRRGDLVGIWMSSLGVAVGLRTTRRHATCGSSNPSS